MKRFDYKHMEQDVAWRLIRKFGYKSKLIRHEKSGPEYDPETEEKELDCWLVEPDFAGRDYRDDSFIERDERKGYISTELETPKHDDDVMLNGEKYKIKELSPLVPGGRIVLYEFIAAK